MIINKFIIRQSCLLFLTALIWGVAFAAQSAGMDYVQPFTFNAVRCMLGGIVLIPCITVWQKERKMRQKTLYKGGIICGILLFIASNFQQFGIQYTTAGKAGFLTALYIIIVPFLGIFLHRRVGKKVWLGVALALCGLYLLCIKEDFRLEKGDALIIICAFTFSFHIMAIDYFSPKVESVKMSCIQFFVCGILSAIGMFIFEQPQISQILAAWKPILYAGVFSCGVAYTLQIVGQKGMNPTAASLILSMESAVSVLAGWALLHETLSRRELIGCLFMFIAIILAQLPQKIKNSDKKEYHYCEDR